MSPPGSQRCWRRPDATSSSTSNLHAVSFVGDAREGVARIPAERVAAVHVAGGRWVGAPGARRLLDDHLHPVPEPVYALLEEVAARAPRPLTVILERDGRYPPFADLLDELDRVRAAPAAGRARKAARAPPPSRHSSPGSTWTKTCAVLPRGPTPGGAGGRADPPEIEGLFRIDRVGLALAAEGFARKRAAKARLAPRGLWERIRRSLRRSGCR